MWHEQQPKMKILLQRLEKKHAFKATHIYSWAANGFAANLNQKQIVEIKAIPGAHIEENVLFQLQAAPKPSPNALTIFSQQWFDSSVGGQFISWGIKSINAHLSSAKSGLNTGVINFSKTRLYVLDSGVDLHPDLNVASRLSANIDGTINDCIGHGTSIAGIAGARNNGFGVAGVAPGVPIISIKITEACTENIATTSVKRAVDIAVRNEVDVFYANSSQSPGIINYSAGALNPSFGFEVTVGSAFINAATKTQYTKTIKIGSFIGTVYVPVTTKGIFSAVAAGNAAGTTACNTSPANIGASTLGVMTVGSIDNFGRLDFQSPYGPCVEIFAPGVAIRTTTIPARNNYEYVYGTSFATPFVAGLAALISQTQINQTAISIEGAIKNKAAGLLGSIQPDGSSIFIPQAGSF